MQILTIQTGIEEFEMQIWTIQKGLEAFECKF